jgi:Phosphatidylinositol 3- and 4-kinase
MKLSREMVDGMGGTTSPYYSQFKSFCFTAYTTLRKSANLILNLFSLMVDANIPDILIEPDKAVLKVIPIPLKCPCPSFIVLTVSLRVAVHVTVLTLLVCEIVVRSL